MFFKLKKIDIRNIFLPFVILFFIASALAQNSNDPLDLDYMEEDIACEDLPEALMKYNLDTQLDRMAVKSTLSDLVSLLQKGSDEKQLAHSELEEMIENINNMIVLIQSNDLRLLSEGDDIHFFLKECLKPSHLK